MSGDGPDPLPFPPACVLSICAWAWYLVKPLPLQDLQPKIEQAEQAGCVAWRWTSMRLAF